MKKTWFGVNRFWGWYPSSWQGFIVIATMFAAIIYITFQADLYSHSVSDTLILAFPFICLITTLTMLIALFTGSKPEFGEKNRDSKSFSPDSPEAYLVLATLAIPLGLYYLVNRGYVGTGIFVLIFILQYQIYLKLKSSH